MNDPLDWWQALLLGIVQGLTEFLPVSSSGHLALAESWLAVPGGGVGFAVLLHMGTLVAIVLVFRGPVRSLASGALRLPANLRKPLRDWNHESVLAAKVVVATIPGALVGLFLNEPIKHAFESTDAVGAYLLVTGAILLATRWAPAVEGEVGWLQAFLIGWAQACAILPGISRSGATISVALFLGIGRQRAAEFSFLAAIPLIVGSLVLELPGLLESSEGGTGVLATGFFVSFGVGWAALVWLMRVVRTGRLHWFSAYCLLVGLLALVAPRL